MNCNQTSQRLGCLLDGELPAHEVNAVEAHIQACARCREDWERLRQLSASLQVAEQLTRAAPPVQLWTTIERRLEGPGTMPRRQSMMQLFRRPLALAASVALLVGAGLLFSIVMDRSVRPAEASVIDYSILMDGITADVHGAIDRFLRHYRAEPVDVAQAHASAPDLSFNVPEQLDGGYRLVQAYRLQFGKSPGVGAVYERGNDPIFVFFHPMSDNIAGPTGTSCLVGDLHGSQIQVGPWRLLHIMDATTCHCILTTMNPGTELESVIRAVAPDVRADAPHHEHQHVH